MTFIGEATVTVADGGLGARQQTDRPLAVVGCSSSGTAATPVLVQSIAHAIETWPACSRVAPVGELMASELTCSTICLRSSGTVV